MCDPCLLLSILLPSPPQSLSLPWSPSVDCLSCMCPSTCTHFSLVPSPTLPLTSSFRRQLPSSSPSLHRVLVGVTCIMDMSTQPSCVVVLSPIYLPVPTSPLPLCHLPLHPLPPSASPPTLTLALPLPPHPPLPSCSLCFSLSRSLQLPSLPPSP
jgi:hypothetical protein